MSVAITPVPDSDNREPSSREPGDYLDLDTLTDSIEVYARKLRSLCDDNAGPRQVNNLLLAMLCETLDFIHHEHERRML